MSINSRDAQLAAMFTRQPDLLMSWSAGRTCTLGYWTSLFGLGGVPGAGVLDGTSTTAGVVPTHTDAGFPEFIPFDAGKTGYIDRVSLGTQANPGGGWQLCDLLFKAGAYAWTNGTTTLSSQPSFASRLPLNGASPDYRGLQLWVETATGWNVANVGSVIITYTNQDGVTGRVGTCVMDVSMRTGTLLRVPLQGDDTGVQKVESVQTTSTAGSSGGYNVLIMRKLWLGMLLANNDHILSAADETGLAQVFDTSALYVAMMASTTSTPTLAEMLVGIIQG